MQAICDYLDSDSDLKCVKELIFDNSSGYTIPGYVSPFIETAYTSIKGLPTVVTPGADCSLQVSYPEHLYSITEKYLEDGFYTAGIEFQIAKTEDFSDAVTYAYTPNNAILTFGSTFYTRKRNVYKKEATQVEGQDYIPPTTKYSDWSSTVSFSVPQVWRVQENIDEEGNLVDVTFIPPSFDKLRESVKNKVAHKRWELETAGVYIDGKFLQTDRQTRATLAQILEYFNSGDIEIINFKFGDTLTTLSKEQFIGVYKAVFDYVQKCFSVELKHLTNINSFTTLEELGSYTYFSSNEAPFIKYNRSEDEVWPSRILTTGVE